MLELSYATCRCHAIYRTDSSGFSIESEEEKYSRYHHKVTLGAAFYGCAIDVKYRLRNQLLRIAMTSLYCQRGDG